MNIINVVTIDMIPEIDWFYIVFQFKLIKVISPYIIIWIPNVHILIYITYHVNLIKKIFKSVVVIIFQHIFFRKVSK
jgi:hypothetical protein